MIKYTGGFCLLLAILALIMPLPWLISAIAAAALHELAHYLTILATGNLVYSLELTHRGAVMHTSSMTLAQEFLCAISGPLASILLFFCYAWSPRIALCASIQGAFNLLPLGTSDGGRILSCFLQMCFPNPTAERIGRAIKPVVLLAISVGLIGIYRSYWPGYGTVFLFLLVLSGCLSEKFLAKKVI